MSDTHRKFGLPPEVSSYARLLILGSLPGDASLTAGQYYAHPRNQFWTLIGKVLNSDLDGLDYPLRLERLADAGIGLWDVIASAKRAGSLDQSIGDYRLCDIVSLCSSLPDLRMIAFNGAKAANLARSLVGIQQYRQLSLPSSSPANTRPLSSKWLEWRGLRDFL